MQRTISTSCGYLEVKLGPMFSGKTSFLVMRATQLADLDYKVLYINYAGDTRSDTEGGDGVNFTSHSSTLKLISSKVECITTTLLCDVSVGDFDAIMVDEAHFYTDLVSVITKWVTQDGKHVYVSALDGNYAMQSFGDTLKLLPLADNFEKVVSQCKICLAQLRLDGASLPPTNTPAPFTMRTVVADSVKLIGGHEAYIATCRRHHSIAK